MRVERIGALLDTGIVIEGSEGLSHGCTHYRTAGQAGYRPLIGVTT